MMTLTQGALNNNQSIKSKNFRNIKCHISEEKYNKIKASKISFNTYINNKIMYCDNIKFNLDAALDLNLNKNTSISLSVETYQYIAELSQKLKLSKTQVVSFIIEML